MDEPENNEILIFSDEFPPDGGGAGIVARQLAFDLSASHKEITLLVGRSDKQRITNENIIEVSRPTLIWPIMYVVRLALLHARKFKIIVLNDNVAAYIAGLCFSKALLKKSTIVVHGEDAEFFLNRRSLRHHVFQYRFFYKRTLRHCNRVLTSSKYARDEFLKDASHLINPAKVQHAYMGINPAFMGVQTLSSKADLGIPDNAIFLFTASRLVEDKGLLTMLEHFMEAASIDSRLHWHIAGEGPLRARLEGKIKAYSLQGRVVLLGKLNRSDMANHYSLADVFWLLSRRKGETFGLVYIEAAYYGTPSIGLRYAGVPEAISEGVSGYFLDEGVALSELISKCLVLNRNVCKDFTLNFMSINFARKILGED